MTETRVKGWQNRLRCPPSQYAYINKDERLEIADLLQDIWTSLKQAAEAAQTQPQVPTTPQPSNDAQTILSPIKQSIPSATARLKLLPLSDELEEDFAELAKAEVDSALYGFAVSMTVSIHDLVDTLPSSVFAFSEREVKLVYDKHKIYILADPEDIRVSISVKRMDKYKLNDEGISSALIHVIDAMMLGPDSYVPKYEAVTHDSPSMPDISQLKITDDTPFTKPQFESNEQLKNAILNRQTEEK